jgi:hypothetical protein
VALFSLPFVAATLLGAAKAPTRGATLATSHIYFSSATPFGVSQYPIIRGIVQQQPDATISSVFGAVAVGGEELYRSAVTRLASRASGSASITVGTQSASGLGVVPGVFFVPASAGIAVTGAATSWKWISSK